MNDLKFALRQLRKSPGFTSLAVITLALGLGVNSAIFALVNGVVLRSPIPSRPDEVVNVFTVRQNASHDYRQFSHVEYRELRENGGDVFADVAATINSHRSCSDGNSTGHGAGSNSANCFG